MTFKVLDLFSGIGGTAKGIIRYLYESGIEYYYTAIDTDLNVMKAYEKNIPGAFILEEDAYEFGVGGYDFIWASPPCQSHSQLNMYMNRKNPDMRLWNLIRKLKQQKTPFIVENVKPYYKTPIKPTVKIGRHLFWSNKPIDSFPVPEKHRNFERMEIADWSEYHGIEESVTEHIKDRIKRRQVLRNMTHHSISYNIIKQILNPKQKQLEVV